MTIFKLITISWFSLLFNVLAVCQEGLSINQKLILDSLITDQINTSNLPGMSVVISKNNQIIYRQGFGYADLDSKKLINPDSTLFRIGSISKSLTAAGLAILVDNNTIELDAQVQKYVPYFPQKEYEITIRDIACHRAGIRHYKGIEFMFNQEYPNVMSGIEIFKDDPLEFEPKTQYKYSSYGWNLISAAIEGASRIDFLAFMRNNVFIPLNMTLTFPEKEGFFPENMVSFYLQNEQYQNLLAPNVNNSYKWAGGGFLSTATDLIKFANGIINNKLYDPEIKNEFWTSCTLSDGSKTNYGLGWVTNKDDSGREFTGHSGGSVGGSSMLLIYPEEELVVVTLVNLSRARMNNLPMRLANIILSD